VEFKLCVLVFNGLHNVAPNYLSTMCQPVTENPSRRYLRSAARGDLAVPLTRTTKTTTTTTTATTTTPAVPATRTTR